MDQTGSGRCLVGLFVAAILTGGPVGLGRVVARRRPFRVVRFPRDGLAKVGHLPPPDKLRQLQQLGARLYACGPSMEHYKVDADNLAFDNVIIAAYLTFMEQLDSADIHLVA